MTIFIFKKTFKILWPMIWKEVCLEVMLICFLFCFVDKENTSIFPVLYPIKWPVKIVPPGGIKTVIFLKEKLLKKACVQDMIASRGHEAYYQIFHTPLDLIHFSCEDENNKV